MSRHKSNPVCAICGRAARVCLTSRVNGGYGHKLTGLAFYYFCRAHEPPHERTDMSEPVERRLLEAEEFDA